MTILIAMLVFKSDNHDTIEYTYIYKLIDPRTKEPRYIGRSPDTKDRLSEHISESKRKNRKGKRHRNKTPKDIWITSLLQINLKPILEVISKISKIEGEYWEEFYIKKYKYEFNHNLLNCDDRGRGSAGLTKEWVEAAKKKSKKVIQYDFNGKKLNTFVSLHAAEEITGIAHGNISRVCNRMYRHIHGFIFRYAEDKSRVYRISKPMVAKKRVILINSNGELKEFESITQASIYSGVQHSSISRICNGKRKQLKNINFKFLTNE